MLKSCARRYIAAQRGLTMANRVSSSSLVCPTSRAAATASWSHLSQLNHDLSTVAMLDTATTQRHTTSMMNGTSLSGNNATQVRYLSSSDAGTNNDENSEKTQDEEQPVNAEDESTATTESEAADVDEVPQQTEEEKLQAQVKDLKDQLLRSLADQENTRTIAKNDVARARDFAISSFAKSLLDVSDNLTRALDAVPKELQNGNQDGSGDGEPDPYSTLASLYQGIHMTNEELTKAFQKNGLTKFSEQPGDVFDPTQHDAMMEYIDETKTPGTVGQVVKCGFLLNGRVLRPAQVGVIKKPLAE